MIYRSAEEWRGAERKRVLLFGTSGVGKTTLSKLLRGDGGWYHYSIDYRIGTRYMGEHIVDSFKKEAMRVPLLRRLLMSDSIYIGSNIAFDNLSPLSTFLGKPGDKEKGGLEFDEYLRRQDLHRSAEIKALKDTPHFISRAWDIYGYPNFVCDSGGSICEVVSPEDPDDPVLNTLAGSVLLVWIEGSDSHSEELIRRFDRDPKPMYYQPDFLAEAWTAYLAESGTAPERVDPDAFVRWAYARSLARRQPRYSAMAERWGVAVSADAVAALRDDGDFVDLVAEAIESCR